MNILSEKVINRWKIIHNHYSNIKIKHNLTSSDILRQLNCKPCSAYLLYLSDKGIDRTPATREGTIGKGFYDILIPGMKKVDWTPSTASYSDKLKELNVDMGYLYITVNIVDEQSCNATPDIEIFLCLEEGPDINKEQLTKMFTIDNVIPNILRINYLRHL